ncbi:MAG: hypothetical protein AB1755_01125 [Candidatus Omnitrophota bacterium]
MLKINFSVFAGIYIFLFIGLFIILWLLSFLKQSRQATRKQSYAACDICMHIWQIDQKENSLICPRCKSYYKGGEEK